MKDNEIFTRRLPFPKFKTKTKSSKSYPNGRWTEHLCTLNNTTKFIKFKKTEIKNTYKNRLIEYYLPDPEQIYDELTVEYRIVRHNNTSVDKDNVVWALKWIADAMAEIGYVKNDKIINFHSFDQVTDSSLPETMIEIRAISRSEKW